MAKTKGAVKKPARTARTRGTATRPVKPPRPPTLGKATKPTKPSKPTRPAKTVSLARRLPTIAVKPRRPTAPSLPLPPPPPAPPPGRDELLAPRDIGRLLRYGEQFGAHKIDVRMLPLQLPAASGALAVVDAGVPRSWRVFDRPVSAGQFRVMLSVARSGDKERLAAVVIHVGRPPTVKWTVAHHRGQKKPRSAELLPRVAVTTGWLALIDAADGSPGMLAVPPASGITPIEVPLTDGRRALALPCGDGEFTAYWGVDAADKPVCLVVDFDVFTQKDWRSKVT